MRSVRSSSATIDRPPSMRSLSSSEMGVNRSAVSALAVIMPTAEVLLVTSKNSSLFVVITTLPISLSLSASAFDCSIVFTSTR